MAVAVDRRHQQRGLKRINLWTEAEIAALRAMYSRDMPSYRMGLEAFAAALGRNKANVCRKARELGLTNQRRAKLPPEERVQDASFPMGSPELKARQSITAREAIAKHGHPRGALGMRHTDEAKARIAAKSAARWAAMSDAEKDEFVFKRVKARRDAGIPFANPRGTWKAAWREIGEQRCFFRSRWEANYARYLEWLRSIGQIKSWEHEPHTFWFEGIRRGCVSYLPDFKVTENDGSVQWHEVKGWMDARSKTTLARMAKYHPKEVLVVIREKQYREIERKVSSLLAGWES